jgi:hypothetical protein
MPNWKKLITSGSDASLNSVLLNATPSPIPTTQGSMYFDEGEETLAVILNGTTQRVGEDVFFQIKNQTGVTIPRGTAVRFDGVVGTSGRLLAVPFLANGTYTSQYFLGVTSEAILDGADGKAYVNGKVKKLNTNAYTVGTILYCSSTVAGGFQTTPPIAPNNIISAAVVIAQSATVGKLLIRPQLGSNINNDEGVKIVSGAAGNLLQLQSNGLWENKTLAQAGIQTTLTNPITGTGTLNYVSKFTGTTSLGNSQIYDNGTNVGIGTTAPQSKLEVNGTGIFSGKLTITADAGNEQLLIQRAANTNQQLLFGYHSDGYGRIQAVEQNVGFRPLILNQSGGNVGIGTTSPTGKLDVQGLVANDLPTYSAEFLLATTWVSTGWTGDWATGWIHTVGNVSVLSHNKVAVNTTKYQIAYTVTGRTAGSFTIGFGGQSNASISATGAWGPTTTSTAALTITPTTDFNGTIVISIKSITGVSTPLVNLRSSDGTARIEIRANATVGNTFIGLGAGRYNTTGGYNTANGLYSLLSNTTGNYNTANGYASLYSNTTGGNNTANGLSSLYSNTTGGNNTANGVSSLYSNTTGVENTANGMYSLYSNTTGNYNTANGNASLYSNTTGVQNTANGYASLNSNTTGNYNTANGMHSGRYIANGITGRITGNNGIYFGYNSKASADGTDNEIVIGYNAVGNGSNTTTLGNTSIIKTVLRGNVETNGSVKVGDDTAVASAANAGAQRYRVSGNNSYVDVCMQTGASTYEWTNITQHNW